MFSYGAFTMFRGLLSFGVGAMMGAAGFYSKFDKNNSLNIANKAENVNPFIERQIAKAVFKRNLSEWAFRTLFKSALVSTWNMLDYLFD